ncbi:MAG: metallopeptidase family protein [Chloroflexi bacterium]|nr:metallopeptidase family protein [Chloroflexota bacterium]
MRDTRPHRYRRLQRQDLTFERDVARALDGLPEWVQQRLENVAVIVDDEPSSQQLAETGLQPGEILYGLYEGVPLGLEAGPFPLPARIVLFRRHLVQDFRRGAALRREIRRTIIHEVGHHFGLSEADIERLGYE